MRKYPKYKDSGVEWIGEIPLGWSVIILKRLCKIKRGASPRPIDDEKYFDENGEYSWVRISDVSASERYLTKTEQRLSELGSNLSVKMNPQDIFLSIAGSVGKPIITEIKCCIHDGFVWFDNLKYNKEFLYKIFELGTCFLGLGKFGTQLNLNTDTIGSIWVPHISYHEQQQIVTYLDQKTTIIDRIISNSEKKIEILKEQRTSIINHTVTKGLNPNVKMKDSGVEWIGEIPVGWEKKKLKYCLKHISEKGETSKGDIKISPENVENGTGICFNLYSEYEGEGMKFINGDILLNKLRIYLKKIVLSEFEGFSMGEMIVLRTIDGHNKYFHYLLFHQGLIDLLNEQSTGVKLPRVSPDIILNTDIISPPLREQKQIVTYLDQKTIEIDELISTEKRRIDRLKEYRQSLISEVVTGKIMVSNS